MTFKRSDCEVVVTSGNELVRVTHLPTELWVEGYGVSNNFANRESLFNILKRKVKSVNPEKLCDGNCNECPIVGHKNSRLLTKVLNDLYDKFGDEVYEIVQNACPNLTVCYDCRTDDFVHYGSCEIVNKKENDGD